MAKSLGAMIDEFHTRRAALNALIEKENEMRALLDDLEQAIITRLDNDETTLARGKKASAFIVETEFYVIDDIDQFYDFVITSKQPWLLQRRVASNAVKELTAMGDEVPGVAPITKRKLNVRKI